MKFRSFNLLNPKNIGAGLLLLCLGLSADAQQFNNLRFSHYTINDGLSQGLVSGITQDKQGFMWFGTKDGLNRFDGYEFKIYKHDPFDSTSLSDNYIGVLFTDSRGRLWIGTSNGGLDLYDRLRDNFLHVLPARANSGTRGHTIGTLAEDQDGHLWVGVAGYGLLELKFPKDKPDSLPSRIIHYKHQSGDSVSLASDFISNVFVDSHNRLWIASLFAPIQYADPGKDKIQFKQLRYSYRKASRKPIHGGFQYDTAHCSKMAPDGGVTFYEDALHRLWMGGRDGLFLFNPQKKRVTYFELKNKALKQGTIGSINSTPSNYTKPSPLLWLGTFNGVGIFNPATLTLQMHEHNPSDPESIQKGWIQKFYRDQSGSMWVGSNGYGLSKFIAGSNLFPIPTFYNADHTVSSKSFSVRSFLDTKKYLLIGTIDGLWKVNKTTHIMDKANLGDLPYPIIVYNMVATDSDVVWMGCNVGLIRYSLSKDKSRFLSPGIFPKTDPANSIFKLYNDEGELWCLTSYTLSKFDIDKKKFTNFYYTPKPVTGYTELSFGAIYQDPKSNFWVGTNEGLLYFDRSKKSFSRYTTNPADDSSLSFNVVRTLLPDPEHPNRYLWVGTAGGGLNRFDLHTRKFIHFTEEDGLSNNVVYGILADKAGHLWMSTNKGLSRFNLQTHEFRNYTVSDGLQSNEFNAGAFYKSSGGKLFFGGVKGFNAFYPEAIRSNPDAPRVVFTDFRLFSRSVSINDKDSPLKYPISQTQRIALRDRDKVISFQVAGMGSANPASCQYAYKLVPENKNWILMGASRLITFSNLTPGHYTLSVKAANSDGIWSKTPVSLSLTILPPWWKTGWAYFCYLLVAVILIYFLRKYELKRIQLRNRLRVEHLEARKLKELDHLKSRFFANISHEFRTPLTLIMGPLEEMRKGELPEQFEKMIPTMHRNSKRLLQLINQLLDLSKLESGSYQVHATREDLIPFVRQVTHTFSSLAKRKHIRLELVVEEELEEQLRDGSLHCYFDEDILEKILSNLLSNAFKFTPSTGKGEIVVSLSLQKIQKDRLELKVQDNGIGISAEKLPYIFDRFYQIEDHDRRKYGGSGIGLALIKELIDLHQGDIEVSSTEGQGATFHCFFPLNRKIISPGYKREKPTHTEPIVIEEDTVSAGEDTNFTNLQKPLVLVVEDQHDIRKYIRKKLQDSFDVMEAENGSEGLNKGLEKIPDVVISDVMMPLMDGFEFCRRLKTNNLTSHIPVLLLTARAEDTDKLKGLETGADAYLVKPFSSEELLIRVQNLIAVRNKMRIAFSKKLFVKPAEIAVTSLDKTFMENLLASVENHIDDARFSVADLGREVNMSVSQINRKLKALIGQTTQQFIHSVRMQRALSILKNGQDTILEVAIQVGFNDPGYFSKVFRKHFGCLPSEKNKFPEQ